MYTFLPINFNNVVVKNTFIEIEEYSPLIAGDLRCRSKSVPCLFENLKEMEKSDLGDTGIHAECKTSGLSDVSTDDGMDPIVGYQHKPLITRVDDKFRTSGFHEQISANGEIEPLPNCQQPWKPAQTWNQTNPWNDIANNAKQMVPDSPISIGHIHLPVATPHYACANGVNNRHQQGFPKSQHYPAKPFKAPPQYQKASPIKNNGIFSKKMENCKDSNCTTLMLGNLPNSYNRMDLLNMLNQEQFAGLYDFVYLPIDLRTNSNLGYAFVNVTDAEHVPKFWNKFQGYSNWNIPSGKVCNVKWSDAGSNWGADNRMLPSQGLMANIERYRNSPIMHYTVPDECKPVLLSRGERVQFPSPTKAIRAPRMRHFR